MITKTTFFLEKITKDNFPEGVLASSEDVSDMRTKTNFSERQQYHNENLIDSVPDPSPLMAFINNASISNEPLQIQKISSSDISNKNDIISTSHRQSIVDLNKCRNRFKNQKNTYKR